jgi:CheY-like chemotaxis protein
MKYRITVIEDNVPDIVLLEHALEKAGLSFELLSIEDGVKALAYLRETSVNRPDLVLLDLNLPLIDGLELLECLCRQPDFEQVPVIVWSSAQSPRDLDAVSAFPVSRFIIKPTGLEGFLKIGPIIREVLEGKRASCAACPA